ncbi:MAG: YciI family protein [Actinomycetes bacterium]|jgi:hypothetical protein
MKYVILIAGDESKFPTDQATSEAWMKDIFAWYDKWTAAGKLVDGGHELDSSTKAKTVRSTGVTDGPFIEAKEVIGGYSVLETDTIDEAVEIASSWPGVSEGLITMEVRPVVER